MHYLNARQSLRKLLDWRAVPVNENDTTATDEITFGDNDFSPLRSRCCSAHGCWCCSPTCPACTRRPRLDAGAGSSSGSRTSPISPATRSASGPPPTAPAGCAARWPPPGWRRAAGIGGDLRRHRAGDVARGDRGEATGTLFTPHPERTPSFKLRLRYAKPARPGAGRCGARGCCESGARACCRDRQRRGRFAAGDAIEVVSDGTLVGKGISNYSAAELDRVKGMKSERARAVPRGLGGGGAPRPLRARVSAGLRGWFAGEGTLGGTG